MERMILALFLPSCAALAGTINRAGFHEVELPLAARRRLDEPNPYTCSEGVNAAKEDWKVFGTNLGGWLVLEPWITPSLFYQFLGSDRKWGAAAAQHTGMDSYTFCASLGPIEANKQLRKHWDAWVREQDIKAIADTGATHVRIPIGDWQYTPYGPYVGCMDGANEQLDRVLALCEKYGLKALLDIHAVRNSQNGFDNSGQAMRVKWTTVTSQGATGQIFEHWPLRAADWIGEFDLSTMSYPKIDHANVNMTLGVIRKIVAKYADKKKYPAVWGIEPVNEPWQFIPLEPLKQFYWDAYWVVRKGAPDWMYVMHDSFRGYPAAWWDFMKGCPQKAMDSHIYLAWNNPGPINTFHSAACGFSGGIMAMEEQVEMPLIVGEWSLATDNCAMWLNGFNDNLPGYPKVSCSLKPCAEPYMGWGQPGCPPDPMQPLQGPYGTGVSGPEYGKCPVGVEWGDTEGEDAAMTQLTTKQLHSFNQGHGWFMWNFRTEMEPRWSFIEAYYRGWFPKDVSETETEELKNACIPRSCEDQLGNQADGSTCGMRIDWLVLHMDMPVADARVKVAKEYPEACGLCSVPSLPAKPHVGSGRQPTTLAAAAAAATPVVAAAAAVPAEGSSKLSRLWALPTAAQALVVLIAIAALAAALLAIRGNPPKDAALNKARASRAQEDDTVSVTAPLNEVSEPPGSGVSYVVF